tara:strand:+ start:168 stop:4352 length:4185 start_codon:yes stop_codon:yes gene_type:complete
MAERKPYGQEYADAMKRGLVSLYENENAQAFGRGLINNPLSKGITNYIIDPVAELGTRAASAKGIFPFLPDTSILTALTPEVTADRETRESIDADITQYPTMGERLEKRMDRFRADVGAFGEFLFGDVRNAGENLNAGVKFADLPPEQKMASRFFLLDIIPLPGVGPAAKAGAKATRELENLKSRMVTSDGSVGAADSTASIMKQVRNQLGDVSKEELQTISNVFAIMPQKQRIILKDALTDDEFKSLLELTKDKISPSVNPKTIFKGDDGELSVKIQGTGDVVPMKDAELRFTSNGAFQFKKKKEIQNLNPKAKFNEEGQRVYRMNNRTYTEDQLNFKGDGRTYKDIESVKPEAMNYLRQSEFEEGMEKFFKANPDFKKDYYAKKNPTGLMKEFTPKINEALGTNLTQMQLVKRIGDTYGKKEIKGKGTRFETEMTTAFGGKYGDVGFDIGRSTNKSEINKIEDAFEFFDSQGINTKLETKPFMSLEGSQKAIDFLNNAREGLYNVVRSPEVQKSFKAQLGENFVPFKFDKSHADRTLSPSDEASQFQGMDVYDVKILESQVNNILQPDLEKALYRYIEKRDVAGSKNIVNKMNEYSIGTRMNSPYKKLSLEDKKWAEESGIINVPMIEKTGAASNIKDYDNVVFGTLEQPSPEKIISDGVKVRLEYLSKRKKFQNENEKGKFWMTLNKGGIVNAADVQYAAPGGFFSKMFGKPPAYMKEEIAKTDIFSPTTKQQATLKALGPEATAIQPGQVFYSNIELSLSKPNSPVKFDSEKEFYDYINAAGIGRDEVGDARIGPYISAKAKSGEPILSQDIIQITSESPLNQLTTDGYGFRSDKINIAKRDIPEKYDSPAITKGQAVYKEPRYSGTGLMPGYLPNTYRERVLQIDSDKFRGDPGTLPSGSAQSHSFGDNYTIAWGRATDRPAIVNEGEMVDKATGTIINPLALTDTKKLQDIEAKIQTLIEDPLTKVDPDDFQTISQAVEALVQKSGGRLTYDKAKQAVDAQIVQKQKQLRKLQSQFVDEEKRLESISTMKPQNITMTFIDEIQSDIAQSATRKSKELAAKLDVMAEQGISFEAMQEGINRDVLQFFAENKSVARPVGATKLELMPQYEELMAFQKQFSDMAKKRPYELTTQDFAMYENFKKRQGEIIDSMADEINDQLMKALYPDVPLKDRGSWSDAVLKQQLYEAAHRLFVEKDPSAPTHLGVASGDIVAGKAYNQNGSTATDIAERTADKQRRLDNYKDALRANIDTTQAIGNSSLPGVGTHEFYGGPLSRAWDEEAGKVGGHYTSDIERSMRKYAEDNNSKLIIANVAVGESSSSKVYNIINQTTGDVVGQGDTYRQAEAIANDLVDNVGGRYEIKKGTDKNFETEPVFSIPLTKEMLQLNKIYK